MATICSYTKQYDTERPARSVVGVFDDEQPIHLHSIEAAAPAASVGDKALRTVLETVLDETDDTPIELSQSISRSPALSIGRLPPRLRAVAQERDISVNGTPEGYTILQQLAQTDYAQPTFDTEEAAMFTEPYVAYADGSRIQRNQQSTIGFILYDNDGRVLRMEGRTIEHRRTSSEVEMAAAMEALTAANDMIPRAASVTVYMDDERVPMLLTSDTDVSLGVSETMEARTQYRCLPNSTVEAIPREQNRVADALATVAHTHRILWTSPAAAELKDRPEETTKYSV